MEQSPIKDVEIKVLLKEALTNKITDREVYMRGIDEVITTEVIAPTKQKSANFYLK